MDNNNPLNKINKRRIGVMAGAIALVFVLYGFRLFQIQIVEGDEYAAIAHRHTSVSVSIPASRGEILDRNMRPLAVNRTSFSVVIDRAYFPKGEDVEQRKRQNGVILALTGLLSQAGEEWNDSLPITREAPYAFEEGRDSRVAGLKELLGLAEYATADNCMAALVERYKLENYPAAEQRAAAGVQYEMEIRQFSESNPFTFSSDISRDTMYKIQENNAIFTGVNIQTAPVREYVDGTLAPHLIGTVGPIYAEEYADLKEKGYQMNDLLGKSGIEGAMEDALRGVTGTTTIIKDASGAVQGKQETKAPVPGNTVVLTLDSRLQQVAQEALEEEILALRQLPATDRGGFANNGHDVRSGAVVALDPRDGSVLACASWPGYDLSTYNQDYAALLADPDKPLFNRALSGGFAIGSTMKPLVSLAALTEGIVTPDWTINCKKTYEYYTGFPINCMSRHGPLNIVRALQVSCNYYFYDVGRQTTIDTMARYAAQFGFGQRTGVEVGESPGILDSPEYRRSVGDDWYAADTLQFAIGQARNQITPMQLAAYTMALANDGVRYKTHLVHSVRSYDGKETLVEPEVAAKVELSQTAIDTVRQGMLRVVSDGTAKRYFSDAPYASTLAAKTGTAQIASNRSDHGTFIAYGPVGNAQIALAVVVEDGTSGASSRVARKVLDAFFAQQSQGIPTVPEGELLA